MKAILQRSYGPGTNDAALNKIFFKLGTISPLAESFVRNASNDIRFSTDLFF